MGFTKEMYRSTESAFLSLMNSVITEQALILQGRIGATKYASAVSPEKDYVKFAEKYLTAAEMMSRRITLMLGNVQAGAQIDTNQERNQKKSFTDLAEEFISKVAAGVTTDSGSSIAIGVFTTSHFEVTS